MKKALSLILAVSVVVSNFAAAVIGTIWVCFIKDSSRRAVSGCRDSKRKSQPLTRDLEILKINEVSLDGSPLLIF